MTYQAWAAPQVRSVCPIISEPDTIDWGEGEEGDLDSSFLILLLQEEVRSVLKPHARVQLSHQEKCYSKTV